MEQRTSEWSTIPLRGLGIPICKSRVQAFRLSESLPGAKPQVCSLHIHGRISLGLQPNTRHLSFGVSQQVPPVFLRLLLCAKHSASRLPLLPKWRVMLDRLARSVHCLWVQPRTPEDYLPRQGVRQHSARSELSRLLECILLLGSKPLLQILRLRCP